MKKILLFEPWHLGDVAVALSVTRQFIQQDCEFGLVCNKQWKDWALSTGVVNTVIDFSAPWTKRRQREKYNPFHYKLSEIIKFRKNVLDYNPECIVDLRGDIRARFFLQLLFGKRIKIVSSSLPKQNNVYARGEVLKRELPQNAVTMVAVSKKQPLRTATLFFGATDKNRMLPFEKALELIIKLSEQGFFLNLILQPDTDRKGVEEIKSCLKTNTVRFVHGNVTCIAEKIKVSDFVISTDSGWLHAAHFYSKPSIGLFGFDTMKTWLPPGCSHVKSEKFYPAEYRYQKKCRDVQPLATLDVDKVIALAQAFNQPPQNETGDEDKMQKLSMVNA